MKVLHVMAPSPVGGAEQVVLDLTASLAQAGLEVHLAAILDAGSESGNHPFLARIGTGVQVHPVRVPHRAYLEERNRIRTLVRDLRPDVVHTHGYRADVLAGSGARAEGCPVVSTVHGFTGGGLRNRLYEWLQRRAYLRCDHVVPVSALLERELAEFGVPRGRLRTIANARSRPADLLSPAEARRRLGVPEDAFHVGWIGRMSREKGPDVMVEALELMSERGTAGEHGLWDEDRDAAGGSPAPLRSPVHASLIGDGRERQGLMARTGDAPPAGVEIHWPGALEGAARFLPGFDVVVLSSRTEGTPIVALEAMTVGIPLVATRVGGVPELVGADRGADRGWLVPPEDPGALASAILQVRGVPDEARARAEAAREYVEAHASPEKWARSYAEIYDRIVRAPSTSTPAEAP